MIALADVPLAPVPDLPEYTSASAVKSYLSCSPRFYFERVALIRKATSPTLHLGKSIHAALQAFHLARWRGGDDSPEAIASAFDSAVIQLEAKEGPVR